METRSQRPKIVVGVDGSPDPRPALLHEASDAALLVVGSRGLGRVSAVVLGSVSRFLLHHAPCPVEIVPPLE